MKKQNLSQYIISAVMLASGPIVHAEPLSRAEFQAIRSVLKSLNVDESSLSNEQIEFFRKRGEQIRVFEGSKTRYLHEASEGAIYLTCGGGSHGSDKDPV